MRRPLLALAAVACLFPLPAPGQTTYEALAGSRGAASAEPSVAQAIVEELAACGTRHSMSSWTDPKRGIGCGRDVVARRFGATGLRVVVDRFTTKGPRTGDVEVQMENVYAVLPGTDPRREKTAFVVSGHLDSMPSDVMDPRSDAPGADDDASGTTASILAAKALASRPARATLVFAAVSGEEQGLLGARRLKEWLAGQGYGVGAMITNDIVGATNGAADRRLRIFSEGGPDGVEHPSRELARAVEELAGRDAVRLVFRRDRFGRGGDHIPFTEAGLPAVRFTEPLEDYRHQHQTPRVENGQEYGDLVKFLDFPFLARVAAINAQVLHALAEAPEPPRSVVLRGAVTPSARITIEAAEDPARASFEVLRRETTDPRWSVLRTVKEPGEVVLEGISTDNDHFAVRSVGGNGARSIAVPAVAPQRAPAGSSALPPPEKDVFQQDVAWSPDGRWLAFSEYDGGKEYKPDRWAIHLVSADGKERRRVVERAMWVSFSPDGKRLAFAAQRDGNEDLYVVDVEGGTPERVTDHPARDRQPSWSPKGDLLAFVSDREGTSNVWVVAPDGKAPRRLTRDAAKDFNPQLSGDGRQVVFYREKGDSQDQVWIAAADGSGERQVTNDDRNNTFPGFLPDGRVLYSSNRKGERGTLVIAGADGQGRAELRVESFFARVSPDGSRIAFIGGGWPRSAIYVMKADGTGARKLVN